MEYFINYEGDTDSGSDIETDGDYSDTDSNYSNTDSENMNSINESKQQEEEEMNLDQIIEYFEQFNSKLKNIYNIDISSIDISNMSIYNSNNHLDNALNNIMIINEILEKYNKNNYKELKNILFLNIINKLQFP